MKIRLEELFVFIICMLFGVHIVVVYTIGLLMTPFDLPVLFALSSIGVGLFICIAIRRKKIITTYNAHALYGFVIVMGIYVCYFILLSIPHNFPPSVSIDLLYHLKIIEYIQTHNAIAHGKALGDLLYQDLPAGAHIITATISTLMSIHAIRVIFPFLTVFIALKMSIVYFILVNVLSSSNFKYSLAVAGSLAYLFMRWYIIDSITVNNFFFGMVISETFLLFWVWVCSVYGRVFSWVVYGVLSITSIVILLTWSGWLFVLIGASIVLMLLVRKQSYKKRLHAISILIIPSVIYLSWYLSVVSDTYSSVLSGSADGPTLYTNYFVPSLVVVAILSLIGFLQYWQQKKAISIVIMSTMLLAQTVCLYILSELHMVGTYIVYKMRYGLVYFAGIIAIALLGFYIKKYRISTRVVYMGYVVLGMILIGQLVYLYPMQQQVQAIGRSAYTLAIWSRENIPTECINFSLTWPRMLQFTIGLFDYPYTDSERMLQSRIDMARAVSYQYDVNKPFYIEYALNKMPIDVEDVAVIQQEEGVAILAKKGVSCEK